MPAKGGGKIGTRRTEIAWKRISMNLKLECFRQMLVESTNKDLYLKS